jgi:SAM-dependent methyltransferase
MLGRETPSTIESTGDGILMTFAQRTSEGLRKLNITVRPWSAEAIATRNRVQAEMLADHIRSGDTVLDVGCGTAHLTQCVADTFGAKVTGMDVQDFRVAQVPFQQFDGVSIPAPDNSFDHIILSFTLHHCNEPLKLIQDCRRVARRTVMVFEDLPSSKYENMLLAMHVRRFRWKFRLEHEGGDYRSALDWIAANSQRQQRTPMPYEWFADHFYVPRALLVYQLSED